MFQGTANSIQLSADELRQSIPEKRHKPSKRKLVSVSD